MTSRAETFRNLCAFILWPLVTVIFPLLLEGCASSKSDSAAASTAPTSHKETYAKTNSPAASTNAEPVQASREKSQVLQIGGFAKHPSLGPYDDSFLDTIQRAWYSLLDSQKIEKLRSGKVVLEFNLMIDGRVTDMKVVKSDVSDLENYFCERAILDSTPFPAWSPDMRRVIGKDYRKVKLSFRYD